MATSSTRSGGSCGLRRISSRMQRITRSSARVSAYMPPALPNGVRTPSTKTTSRTSRGTASLPAGEPKFLWSECYSPVTKVRQGVAENVTAVGCANPRSSRDRIGQHLGKLHGEQLDLPVPRAEAAQRVGDRLRRHLIRRGPGEPANVIGADQIFRGKPVR